MYTQTTRVEKIYNQKKQRAKPEIMPATNPGSISTIKKLTTVHPPLRSPSSSSRSSTPSPVTKQTLHSPALTKHTHPPTLIQPRNDFQFEEFLQSRTPVEPPESAFPDAAVREDGLVVDGHAVDVDGAVVHVSAAYESRIKGKRKSRGALQEGTRRE